MEWCWRDVSYEKKQKVEATPLKNRSSPDPLSGFPMSCNGEKKTGLVIGEAIQIQRSKGRFGRFRNSELWAEAICPTRELAMQAVRFCDFSHVGDTVTNPSEYSKKCN